MKDLTESEQRALGDLLYLVTHDEAVSAPLLARYSTLRPGNPDMVPSRDFAALLETLYSKSCK